MALRGASESQPSPADVGIACVSRPALGGRAIVGAVGAVVLIAALVIAMLLLAGGREGRLERWSAGRPLTAGELRALRSVFYDAVNYSRIRIARAPFPAYLTACVIGSRITFRPSYYVDDFSDNYLKMALLVHEVGHVWQFQVHGPYATLEAILEHVWYGDGAYSYRLATPVRPLADYGLEQQGHILRDYYERRYLGEDVRRYEATIYRSLRRPATPVRRTVARLAPGAGS